MGVACAGGARSAGTKENPGSPIRHATTSSPPRKAEGSRGKWRERQSNASGRKPDRQTRTKDPGTHVHVDLWFLRSGVQNALLPPTLLRPLLPEQGLLREKAKP